MSCVTSLTVEASSADLLHDGRAVSLVAAGLQHLVQRLSVDHDSVVEVSRVDTGLPIRLKQVQLFVCV